MSAAEKRSRSKTVTKAEVVERVRDATGLGWNESGEILESVLDVMKDTLEAGENVKISGFGNFLVREKSARRGRNPQTSERIVITRRTVLTFKPSLVLRQSLNGPHRGDGQG